MKLYKKIYPLIVILFLISCNESILDEVPLDKYSDPTVWSDINLADAYLKGCYNGTSHGFKGYTMLSAVTDEAYSKHMVGYLDGVISADNVASTWENMGSKSHGQVTWWLFNNVQRINVFLSNIDKVVEGYPESAQPDIKERTEVLKGEALFLRAYAYTQMCRSYGGLPILKEPSVLGDDFSIITRSSFKETVNFILSECDEAAKLLNFKKDMELGRASKEAALSLKSRILLFAASDLTADGTAENELVGYINENRQALWVAAKDAAKDVMDLGTLQLADFGAPDKGAIAKNYYDFFRAQDLSNEEVIWGKMFVSDVGNRHSMNLWMGPNGNNNWSSMNITQNFVDDYEMEDGSSFNEHFSIDADNFYINNSNKYSHKNIYKYREPRFYASILYDSALFQPRFDNLVQIDPVGIYERRTHVNIMEDETTSTRFGLDTRQGPVQNWSGSFTGYVMKKMLDHEIIGRSEANTNVWIEFRYAEIILNYAEACLELGDYSEATQYINMIRNRAGLPNFTENIKDALRHERKIEFAFEEKRWYDIRRWKILEQSLSPVLGIDIVQTTKENSLTTTWQQITAFNRGPVTSKMYWLPISTEELNKAPNIVQNPNY
ncbi:RagB/SusD family nutrient uptake outer membrane protein [Cyclobacterium qasimii]|nr:RagB/SusD family nutrient uptake outer membrane protein [Cyclobacterium qasimii]